MMKFDTGMRDVIDSMRLAKAALGDFRAAFSAIDAKLSDTTMWA